MAIDDKGATPKRRRLFWGMGKGKGKESDAESGDVWSEQSGPAKWSFGVLNDKATVEVPGSVLLLASNRNEPLGLRNAPARTSHSSLPTGLPLAEPPPPTPPPVPQPTDDSKKTTKDGKVILEPQPEDSANDPLNWPAWKRDSALLSLGLFCMVGGGMTPILAAGFTNIAADYNIPVASVSLTTGLYMLGLGIGSVIFSPTAILYGKRPVYLFGSILFILSSIWCALSPNFASLILARIFQGISVSPVECLPSATIAEIFFLHERAFRIGIYTLLLLGGKNLVPLVSAAVIQRLGWRWVFWVVAFVVAVCGILLFFFVPETFWDRTPVPKSRKSRPTASLLRRLSRLDSHKDATPAVEAASPGPAVEPAQAAADITRPSTPHHKHKNVHVGFAPAVEAKQSTESKPPLRKSVSPVALPSAYRSRTPDSTAPVTPDGRVAARHSGETRAPVPHYPAMAGARPALVAATSFGTSASPPATPLHADRGRQEYFGLSPLDGDADSLGRSPSHSVPPFPVHAYTHALRQGPPASYRQQLKPYNGRLNSDRWIRVAIRPFILFSYPAILWSAAVYALSVGWLIVISESVAIIYRNAATYNFNALQAGLVYISPFVGGILGTAVAGKFSDVVVKAMARRNGGLYEPEFRLVMALPVALTTALGLMGFGWSAQEHDAWIVPTVFFGLTSFGCSLGSTTSITFCVDSYRQYAGEALVTLNFSKNVLHGFVFSLFVTEWLTADGAKSVYVWIGVIHLIVLMTSVPMYVYGKRARMWTVRKNFVEKMSVKFNKVAYDENGGETGRGRSPGI